MFKLVFGGKDTAESRKVRESVHCWNTVWIVLSLILVVGYTLTGACYVYGHIKSLDQQRVQANAERIDGSSHSVVLKTRSDSAEGFVEGIFTLCGGALAPLGLLLTSLRYQSLMKEEFTKSTVD